MEDTKLKTIRRVFYACLNSKRRGSALILALIVALVGGAIGALIFEVAGAYLNTTSKQSRAYTDDIIAVGFIEKAKGAVIAENVRLYRTPPSSGREVLRGSANASYDKFIGTITDHSITSSDHLIIQGIPGLSATPYNVDRGADKGIVNLEVWDAMYNPDRVKVASFAGVGALTALANLPPSFFIDSGTPGGFTGENFDEQIQYAEGGGSQSGSLGGLNEIYKRYGVYVIRVKMHNEAGNLIRTTEEAFANMMPSGDAKP